VPFPSLGLNPSQDQPLSLVSAQEGTSYPGLGVVGRGGSSPPAGWAVGTTLRPWEFTPSPSLLPQNVCREAQGERLCVPPAQCWGFTPTCVQGSRGRGDPLRSWQEGDDSAGQDEAQLVLGWGGGYKRGREGRTWALGLGKGLEQSPGGVCLLLKLLAEH